MRDETSSHKRNLFEIENARNLNPKELVDTFVPTQAFWRLLSAKHHVVLGARGSGKTALAKMLSHDHLSMLDDPRAQSAIREQQFIGVYVPTRLEWVGALKNKSWQTEAQKEEYFQWRLNLSSCLALITTLESCIRSYCGDKGEQARAEAELASQLANAWVDEQEIETLDKLRRSLEDIEYAKHRLIARSRASGDERPSGTGPGPAFDSDLLIPLRRGITLASRIFNLKPDCTWLICLDEAEFLDELHQRILNSLMRAHSGNVFFKMTTMPYCHYTLATNTSVSLTRGDDFEYVYIDFDPVLFARAEGEKSSIGTAFARTLFERRFEASGTLGAKASEGTTTLSIDHFLGTSTLLDDKDADWTADSKMMTLLRRFGSPATIKRAEELFGHPNFRPTISRKIHGALLLRECYDELKGRAEVGIYSGARMVVRCGDANPRRLISIFNALRLEAQRSMEQDNLLPRLSQKAQTRVLRKLSTSYLERVQSEPEVGKDLYDVLKTIGTYMRTTFHEQPLTTDHVTSILIEKNVTDKEWTLIQRAVQLGLLFPNLGPQQRGELPNREGTFHLAFILAPHFFLLPRRGHSRSLATIMRQPALL